MKFKKNSRRGLLILSILIIFSSSRALKLSEQKTEGVRDLHNSAIATAKPIDYSDINHWAAHPLKHDPSDSVPEFLNEEDRDTSADVFFLHPTSYTGKFKGWNADIDDATLNAKTDNGSILFQASVFNSRCRVFAPRYRQAHINAFYTRDTAKASAALNFAYQDLKTAFQYYLDHWNHGRPIIIASHSQGTRHGIRLLQEFFDGKPLQKQLVCAYLVGYVIKKDAFKNITWGNSPDQTGCVAGWRSFRKGYVPRFVKKEKGNCLCTNPVTWTTSTDWSPINMHPGLILRDFNHRMYWNLTSAEISADYKILWVDLPRKLKNQLNILNIKNYHIADYNFFYMNIRQNVRDRVAAYLKKNPPKP